MREVILQGMKNAKPIGKAAPNKFYTLGEGKTKTAASALKVLGALNALNNVFKTVGSYARKLVFDSVLPQWLKDVVTGKKKITSFTVSTGDAKALIVPMKKYAPITEERAAKLEGLSEKYGFDIDIVEHRRFVFSDKLIEQIPEEKMHDFIEELNQALQKSKVLTAKVKKDISSGKIEVVQERLDYEYGEDVLTNLPKYADGDPKAALEIVDTVQPVFAIRSFEMEDKEVEVANALDLIKENIDAVAAEE